MKEKKFDYAKVSVKVNRNINRDCQTKTLLKKRPALLSTYPADCRKLPSLILTNCITIEKTKNWEETDCCKNNLMKN